VKCIWDNVTGGIIVSINALSERRDVFVKAVSSLLGATGIPPVLDRSRGRYARTHYRGNSREADFVLVVPAESPRDRWDANIDHTREMKRCLKGEKCL
jgi:hypothetical protein